MGYRASIKSKLRQKQYRKEHKDQKKTYNAKYWKTHQMEMSVKGTHLKQRCTTAKTPHSMAERAKYKSQHRQHTLARQKNCAKRQSEQTTSRYERYRLHRQNSRSMWKYRAIVKKQVTQSLQERRLIQMMMLDEDNANSKKSNSWRLKKTTSFVQTMKRLKIQRLVRCAMALKSRVLRKFTQTANAFQETMINCLENIPPELNQDSLHHFIGGQRYHTSHSEPYFSDTAYKLLPQDFVVAVDDAGIAQNINTLEPITHKSKGFKWDCGSTCNIRQATIDNFCGFIHLAAIANTQEQLDLFNIIDICHSSSGHLSMLGHPVTCIEHIDCPSSLRMLRELSCHYSGVRKLLHDVYHHKAHAQAIRTLDMALLSGDKTRIELAVTTIKQLLKKPLTKERTDDVDSVVKEQRPLLNEEQLVEMYKKGITRCTSEINTFHDTPCASCERLCHKSDVKCLSTVIKTTPAILETDAWLQLEAYWLAKYDGFDTDIYESLFLCRYCNENIKKRSLPQRCALNGLLVDELPASLESLNIFEMMIIQKAKCFQTVVRLGPVKHRLPSSAMVKAVKGRVFYLPLPVEQHAAMLPKGLPLNHELYVLVNGMPTKKKVIWQDIISIEKITNALKTLIEINPLYRDLNISDNYVDNYVFGTEDDVMPILKPGPDALLKKVSPIDASDLYRHYSIHPIHADQPSKQMETYQVKECSGQALSIWDKNLDLMCFPDLFPRARYGKYELRTRYISEAEYRVSRLLNMNGRFRRNQQYLFHLLYDGDIKHLSNSITHMLRQSKTGIISVEEMLTKIESGDRQLETKLSSLFGNIRGTRQYWFARQGEVNCMMREFGPPTWFVTLSCAEYTWENLFDHLKVINSDMPGVDKMTPGELCSCDPVSVCRHYHARFHAILNNLILTKDKPVLGEVEHYFWRVEYQMRGAPHIHMLLWVKDAPMIGTNTTDEILTFILRYVTCSMPDETLSPTLHRYVKAFQKHKCTSYCLRKYKIGSGQYYTHCKFGFPRMERERAKLHDAFSAMRHRQSGKSNKRLYELPRRANESYINDYNPALLLMLGANVDVCYIGESSWCLAKYVTSYITKAEKVEMEELWQELTHKTLSSKLWSLGLKALTHRQCGAYEASDRLLGTHLYGKSESIRFINTNEPHQRNRILKPFKELKQLKENEPDSHDIYMCSYIDTYYPNRPDTLETTCLYDFMQCYDRTPLVDKIPPGCLELKNDLGLLRKRRKMYVINHIQHNPKKSADECERYYHCILMLFLPWRDETELKGDQCSFQDMFTKKKDELHEMMVHHNKLQSIQTADEMAQHKLMSSTQEKENQAHEDDIINAVQGHQTIEAEAAMTEILLAAKQARCTVSVEQLDNQLAQLNNDQIRVFNKFKSHLLNNSDDKMRLFVSGCGGTGKSFLIHTIEMWMHANAAAKTNNVSVSVSAPTGLAAYNVGGVTIHRLLMLPIEHGVSARYQRLSADSLSVLRTALDGLQLLIIDEISMVSSLLLTYIHLRLCEITGHEQLFGGIHILILGDLLQLPPVKGNAPFVQLKADEIRTNLESIGSVNLWGSFDYDELTVNVRQSSDSVYSDLLSRVRIGDLTTADIQLLQSRIVQGKKSYEQAATIYQELIKNGDNPVCLLSKVDACHQMNDRMLTMLGVPIIEIPSIDELDGATHKKAKELAQRKLANLKFDVSRTAGLETQLRLGVGARVMLRRNIDMENGLVNGSIGTIQSFEFEANGQVKKLDISFDNGYNTKLSRYNVPFELMKGIYVHRKQFPVTLAYAITVHKCQGLSLKCAIIDLGNSIFGPGMAYVALSRVTNLTGLHLLDLCPGKVLADNKSIAEYNRLRMTFRPDLPLLPTKHQGPGKDKPTITANVMDHDLPIHCINAKQHAAEDDALNLLSQQQYLFSNRDKVSCYANSIAQIFLHIPQLKNIIASTYVSDPDSMPVIHELQQLISFHESDKQLQLNVMSLRRAVGLRYADCVQLDACEFLIDILTRINNETGMIMVQNLVTGLEGQEQRCSRYPSCQYKGITGHDAFQVMRLHFPQSHKHDTTPISFKDLVENWFSFDQPCRLCGSPTVRRTVIRSAPSLLCVSLCIFHDQNRRINRPVTGYTANDVNIAGKKYETVAAVCHSGHTTQSGHYWCLLKSNKRWISISDNKQQVKLRFVNNLKNVYLLVLQQKRGVEE
jgi:ATP-dependent DNA helicase PIF1